MDGITEMLQELLSLVFVLLTFYKETYGAVMPKELAKSADYLYKGLMGSGSWIGYTVAAAYYFSREYDLGETVCDGLGYGYLIIDELNKLIDISGAKQEKKEEEDAEQKKEVEKEEDLKANEYGTLREGDDMFAGGYEEEYEY